MQSRHSRPRWSSGSSKRLPRIRKCRNSGIACRRLSAYWTHFLRNPPPKGRLNLTRMGIMNLMATVTKQRIEVVRKRNELAIKAADRRSAELKEALQRSRAVTERAIA